MRRLFTIVSIGLLSFSPTRLFNNTAQTLPFTQNWTTTTLITANDDWSGVPGIEGYLGQSLTAATGVDPQTVLGVSGTAGDLTVLANQLAATSAAGDVGEFDGLADPTIGLQGSGTADAPYIVMYLNTTSLQNITVAYNLRDLDASTDNSVQQLALQYRVGNTGNFTNVAAGYVADATTGPSLATLVTPVSAVLPAACDNQAEVQVRVITTNAAGNDEWVGIDDINITGTPGIFNSASSNIIYNTGFTAPANIDYILYQSANITDVNSIEVAQFTIQDGGGAADGDALGTTLTDVVMSLSNSANIQRVAIYDGVTEISEVAGGASVSFSALGLVAPDDGSKTYSVRVTFNAAVTDNQQFVFTITSATADVAGSTFAAGNAGGAASSSAGDDNRIEVTADRLAYVQNTTSPTGINAAMNPAVTLSANDINANRDLDFVEQVRITSTGTLAGTPVDVAAVAGFVSFATLTHTVLGAGLTLTAERTTTLDWDVVSSPFDILAASSATDYFRSLISGPWTSASTWQSSPDNITFQPATLAPDNNANNIYIGNGHTVTITNIAVTADQVEIENGGILLNQATLTNAFIIANGSGDDLAIDAGGVYHVTSGLSFVNYQTVNAGGTVRIKSGGTIRISSVAGSSHNSFATTATTYIWEDASVFDWNTTSTPGATGVTFFPDAAAGVIPIWRFSASPLGNLGGGAPLVVNGVLDANSSVIFTSGSDKTFRNGITGTGDVTQIIGGAGKILITGTTAVLGGAGTIIPVNGIDIGTTTVVTMTSNKTVNGSITLLANSFVELGAFNLTVAGTIAGGSATSYIRTNGAGVLTLPAIGVTAETFPIGNTSYNPLVISIGNNADFSARVATGINDPNGAIPTDAVQRTWYINASANTSGVSVTYQYNLAECVNAAATQPANMEILQSDYAIWHLVPGNTSILSVGADPYTVSGTGMTIANAVGGTPYALGVSGTVILSVDYFITAKAQKLNNTSVINWTVASTDNVNSFEVQRSAGNSSYQTIGTVYAVNGQLHYSLTDLSPVDGTNLYRIKVNRAAGGVRYSNTVAVINGSKGILITGVAPNPASDKTTLTISAAKKGTVSFEIYNLSGTVIKRWTAMMAEGTNTVTIQTGGLSAGVYHIVATGQEARSATRFVKQ